MGVTVHAVAFLWGLAEATLFFVVPDVGLTWLAVHGVRRALAAALPAVAGALLGGAVMFAWGAREPEAVERTLDRVPAIASSTIGSVDRELARHGAAAVFLGPPRGVPFKIYAARAPRHGVGLASFLAASAPARLLRFWLVTLLAALVVHGFARRASYRTKLALVTAGWGGFYAFYLAVMPS